MIKLAILTVSDRSSRGERQDLSGPALSAMLQQQGWPIIESAIVPDELEAIQKTLLYWADELGVNIILTTGGTGFSPRDITPEATLGVIHKLAPGLSEAMRAASLQKTPHAMLSRSVVGIRGKCLIVNLPGSPKGAVENLQVVLPVLEHALQLLTEDPNAEGSH